MSPEDAFVEVKSRYPLDLEKAETEYQGWRLAAERIDEAAAFLNFPPPFKLQDTPDGEQYPANGEEPPNLGKRVFAQSRNRCYSSKLPEGYTHEGMEKHSDGVKAAMGGDFLENNFLSEDRRYPFCSDNPGIAIGTDAIRAVAFNATKDRIRQNFSSKAYKELPSVGKAAFYNPFNSDYPIEYKFPASGRGYCRPPFLISSAWAMAPLSHSNTPEIYSPDPSTETSRVEVCPRHKNRCAPLSISAWVIFHKTGEQ